APAPCRLLAASPRGEVERRIAPRHAPQRAARQLLQHPEQRAVGAEARDQMLVLAGDGGVLTRTELHRLGRAAQPRDLRRELLEQFRVSPFGGLSGGEAE